MGYKPSTSSDVYSFGVTLLEIISGKRNNISQQPLPHVSTPSKWSMEPFPFLKNRLKPGVYIRQDLYIQPKLIYRTSCDEVLNAFELVVKMATTFSSARRFGTTGTTTMALTAPCNCSILMSLSLTSRPCVGYRYASPLGCFAFNTRLRIGRTCQPSLIC